MNEVRLITDDPLDVDASAQDSLGFSDYADALAQAVLGAGGPVTVGVFGDWGTGKTSLLKLMQGCLEDSESKPICVWFNAWQYEGEEHPLIALSSSLVLGLQQHESFGTKSGKALVKGLRSLIYGLSFKGKIGVPLVGELELSASQKEMVAREEALTDNAIERSLYMRAFARLSDASKSFQGRKIVVFIDDLDRCFPENAIKLLEGIKLALAQPGFAFVLGLDHATIASFVSSKYSGVAGVSGNSYLDKLFQVSFFIPDYTPLIPEYAAELIQLNMGEAALVDFQPILPAIAPLCRNNPRAVKRFLNNLIIDRAIAERRPEIADLPLVYLGLARALQMHWPRVAEAIRYDDEGICGVLAGLGLNREADSTRLAELALDKTSAVADVYDSVMRDRLLQEVVLSSQAKEWLGSDLRVQSWTLLEERSQQEMVVETDAGGVYRVPKRGRVINPGRSYPSILSSVSQSASVRELWPELAEEIIKRGQLDFWHEILWERKNDMVGRVLGTMKHFNKELELYLMEFRADKEIVYYVIDSSAVELLSSGNIA